MFDSQLDKLVKKVNSARRMLHFKVALMEFFPKENQWGGTKVIALMNAQPELKDWKISDHVTCFSSLYSAYETFVHEIIEGVLTNYSTHTDYFDLPTKLTDRHSIGMGEALQKLNMPRYSHLEKSILAEELYNCINGTHPYTITPETIYAHDNNLRMDILIELFTRVDYDKLNEHLQGCNDLNTLMERSESSHSQILPLLKEFIDRRNECSHGEIDEILSISQLLFFCDFVATLCISIHRFSKSKTIKMNLSKSDYVESGKVTECFSDNISVVVAEAGRYEVGENFILSKEHAFNTAEIISIRIDNVDYESYSVLGKTEIGLKTSIKLMKGTVLFLAE
jgi:hypothetical protein